MPHVTAPVSADASELAVLVREHLDALCTYATHLVGDSGDALEFVAAGLHHAGRYPPTRIDADGRVALYRAVTNACRHGHRFPPRRAGPARLFRRARPPFSAEIDADAAERINTVKRALMTLGFERRAALLLRDLIGLSHGDLGRALECSPNAAARVLAGARREFGGVYRDIRL